MSNRTQIFFLFLAVGLFAFFCFHSAGGKREPERIERRKPIVPEPMVVRSREHPFKKHPWIQLQSRLENLPIEVERDLLAFHEVCHAIGDETGLSEEKLTSSLIRTLLTLQQEIPFTFPSHLYNVLMIPEQPQEDIPAPFHVYQRLYLDDTELGLPFYLDVRVFALEGVTADELITWHLGRLTGKPQELFESETRRVYLVTGTRNPDYEDLSHGFAPLQGERGLFLDAVEIEGRLFIAYAEAPLKTFEQHLLTLVGSCPHSTNLRSSY